MNNGDGASEGEWVIAEAPARVDMSGGWSDTPPITNEHGGVVTNVAVKVDGIRPIGAKIRKIPEFELLIVVENSREDGPKILRCKTFDDMKDYCNPAAPGALIKAAFLCTNTVVLLSSQSLAEQLKEKHGCGFEIRTWSHLHFGSGMGTSSILAGVVCAAIWRIMSRSYDDRELLHLVMKVEKMLTIGGGWQDQVGGIVPGVKMTRSPAREPLEILPEILDVCEETLMKVITNMALIYTGKTRLAKDILQIVIARWRARTPEIVNNVHNLTKNAEQCAEAWVEGDLKKMGHCLNVYREQKKIMAPGSETEEICEIINSITPFTHGCCFAGAGGGGYLLVITKEPNIHTKIEKILQDIAKGNNSYTVHRIEVDTEGLTVK
ncbi:L-fucose kinase-like [Dendronephthya gigantea]|uniref:L-fucose kinase-like n=1 Tax=Dendronephthya gigantea TaxID=151771 RepID=UPI001069C49D|nr:L-fucose kinase-like [Dendronephthya gigantea]XP_028398763.1 L-fucose kinase-like [Dendronephthya gigantea]